MRRRACSSRKHDSANRWATGGSACRAAGPAAATHVRVRVGASRVAALALARRLAAAGPARRGRRHAARASSCAGSGWSGPRSSRPQAVDRVVDEAAEAGFNALFVQVRGRGDAFYRSALAPRSVLLERQPRDVRPAGAPDRAGPRAAAPGPRLGERAARGALRPAAAARATSLEQHPEWVMVPRSAATAALVASGARRLAARSLDAGRAEGDVEGYYLSPAVPGGRRSTSRPWCARSCGRTRWTACTSTSSATRGRRSTTRGRRSRASAGARAAATCSRRPTRSPAAWDDYRRELLTALATRLARRRARASGPGIVLSAAVAPDEAQAVQPQVPGLAALAGERACSRRSAR